jgi:hypothetical protein
MTDINVGTPMLVRRSGIGGGCKIHLVEKVYKRHFICAGLKWQLDGYMRCMGGNKWYRPSIRLATPEDAAAIAAEERRYAVSAYEWRTADQSAIDAVYAVITAPRTAPNVRDHRAADKETK